MLKSYERFRQACVATAWGYFFFMAYMLLNPRPPVDFVPQYMFSAIHFFAFAALGALVGLGRRKTSSYYWFGILFLWCSGSEYLQPYFGRFFELMDIVQNTLGVGVGLLFASLLRRALEGSQTSKQTSASSRAFASSEEIEGTK